MSVQYRRGDNHVYRVIAGEHLLVALHGDSPEPLFALTATAAVLWEALATWTPASSLVGALVESFEVDPGRAEADVADFLEQLQSVGALRDREGGE